MMTGYNSGIESGSASVEEETASELHLVTNMPDVSMWESWGTRAASSGHDVLASAANSSTAELGYNLSPRLTLQQTDNMLSGWLSTFHSMAQTGLYSLLCEHPDHPSVHPMPCTGAGSQFIRSDGQQLGSALNMYNSTLIDDAGDQSSDVQALELADLYTSTGVKNLHAEESPYCNSVSAPHVSWDEELSSDSYSTSRDGTFSYGKVPLVDTAQTALQLLQSLDSDQSPSSPLPPYNSTPPQLPFFRSWDGNYVPVSTRVSNCPPSSELLAGGTNLQLMHADSCRSTVNQFSAELQAAERELFPANFFTSEDPYYATYHPRAIRSDHPKAGTIDRQFDALMHRSVVTWPNCNAGIFSEMLGNFSAPIAGWAPGCSDVHDVCRNHDLQSNRKDQASNLSTTVSTIPKSSCSTGVVELAELHLKDRPGKHRLELVDIDCEDETGPPLKRKGHERKPPTSWQRIQNLKCAAPDPKSEFESNSSSSSSLQSEVMDIIAVGPALNTNGKPRARRGSAADPQSIYARHRRNKINERLKTLQHLVPNGAKVDIVTMLEEAIDYVKYLQNQVKMLKMEQWMSGIPTIYNGVDISAI